MSTPLILFGAFDRHNLGDLLFPHVVQALLGQRDTVCVGLVDRDLRGCGGHRVVALPRLAAGWGEQPAHVIHVGGELLTCDAWQAAVMVLPGEQAGMVIATCDPGETRRREWARSYLGSDALAAYLVAKNRFPYPGAFIYNAVGGVDLASHPAPYRAEVLDRLREADYLAVRDNVTLEILAQAGIKAQLVPDCAIMVGDLFGERIAYHAARGEPARIRAAFPHGYAAIQFSADFADDATLDLIAGQLDAAAREAGLGLVIFRAGAAPWHDDTACFERLIKRLRYARAAIFTSLNIWDDCALLGASRVYCGSSLHGRILALALGVPGVNFLPPDQVKSGIPTKQAAYAETWLASETSGVVSAMQIAPGIVAALQLTADELSSVADRQREIYRHHFAAWCKLLPNQFG